MMKDPLVRFVVVMVVWAFLSSATAKGAWEGEEKPTFGTAYTLRGGEWLLGILGNAGVGLGAGVEVSTVLWGDLLTVFNLGLKANVVNLDSFAMSLGAFGGYTPLFGIGGGGGNAIFTFPLGHKVLLSVYGSYVWIGGKGDTFVGEVTFSSASGAGFGGHIHFILNPHDLIYLTAGGSYDISGESLGPAIIGVGYAHCWKTFRLMVGAMYKTGSGFVLREADPDEGKEEIKTPVFPMINLWWRW